MKRERKERPGENRFRKFGREMISLPSNKRLWVFLILALLSGPLLNDLYGVAKNVGGESARSIANVIGVSGEDDKARHRRPAEFARLVAGWPLWSETPAVAEDSVRFVRRTNMDPDLWTQRFDGRNVRPFNPSTLVEEATIQTGYPVLVSGQVGSVADYGTKGRVTYQEMQIRDTSSNSIVYCRYNVGRKAPAFTRGEAVLTLGAILVLGKVNLQHSNREAGAVYLWCGHPVLRERARKLESISGSLWSRG